MIHAISPLDGRYANKLKSLSRYFSEYALIHYRLKVEVDYFIRLFQTRIIPAELNPDAYHLLKKIVIEFSDDDARRIKEIESTTNHDVKALEYFLKEKISNTTLDPYKEFIHFALTSQDINNTATPLMLKDFTQQLLLPKLHDILKQLSKNGQTWIQIPMLAKTHGQPASPTTMGKEWLVFAERLGKQIDLLKNFEFCGKFGGATGNFNAHYAAYPQTDWPKWADTFLKQDLGLTRQYYTTQIAHYDEIAEWCHILIRIQTILLDFCRDIWSYISMEYFRQQIKEGEIGSSAMPHKVNPIDFENAEGNLGLATALASHLAEKLPVSRLQRDLTDSTVLRNLGVPAAHLYLALLAIENGLSKLLLNEEKLTSELDQNWIILAEPIQTILRREHFPKPYEALKELTRVHGVIQKETLHQFIRQLQISEKVKEELLALTPSGYIGMLNQR